MPSTLLMFCLVTFMMSCYKKSDSNELIKAINQVCNDFGYKELSYQINVGGSTASLLSGTKKQLDSSGTGQFISELTAPLLLDKLIRDSALREDSTVNKLLGIKGKKNVYPSDLVSVPANLEDEALDSQRGIPGAINRLITLVKWTRMPDVECFKADFNNGSDNPESFFEKIHTVSEYFDRSYPYYKSIDTNIVSINPTWYTRNIRQFFGWNVFRIRKRTILWKEAIVKDRHVLVIKYLDKDILISISYKGSATNSTGNDILRSPFGISILKVLLAKGTVPSINYRAPEPDIYNRLLGCQSNPLYVLYLKELAAYADMYQRTGRVKQSQILINVYRKLTNDPDLYLFLNRPSLAEINYVADNADITKPFKLKENTDIQLFAAGQAVKNNDYLNAAYLYDNLQLFINKNTDPRFIIRNENKEFEFNYRFDKIHIPSTPQQPNGWINDPSIRFAYSDPTDTSYVLEIAIPWNRLDCRKPVSGTAIAMNVFIGDSDVEENQRKSILSWTVKGNQDYNDPGIFGRITFLKTPRKNTGNILNSLKVATPPVIDGLKDAIWDKVYFSAITIPYQGSPSSQDNSARFKSLYDNDNLYLLFYVTDNCKNVTGIVTKDKCWIENSENGEVVWKMNGKIQAGSASFSTSAKLNLKAGKYKLRYTSDSGNSFEGWYGSAPANGIYGVNLYALPASKN